MLCRVAILTNQNQIVMVQSDCRIVNGVGRDVPDVVDNLSWHDQSSTKTTLTQVTDAFCICLSTIFPSARVIKTLSKILCHNLPANHPPVQLPRHNHTRHHNYNAIIKVKKNSPFKGNWKNIFNNLFCLSSSRLTRKNSLQLRPTKRHSEMPHRAHIDGLCRAEVRTIPKPQFCFFFVWFAMIPIVSQRPLCHNPRAVTP